MIKNIPFDIPASFLIGMLIALVCADKIKQAESVVRHPGLMGVVLFELFFFIPLGAYLYFFHTDWSLMYFVDPGGYSEAVTIVIGVCALACYLAAAVAGFLIAAKLIRDDKKGTAAAVMAGVALALGIFSLFTFRQIILVGTYAQWTAVPRIETVGLYAHTIGYVIAVDALLATVALAAMLRSLARPQAEI